MVKSLVLGLATAALLTLGPVQAEEYTKTVQAARTSAWRGITTGRGSGAAVAVMDKGRLVVSEGFGVGDHALNNPVTGQTRFNIGSVSKMFATVAVLLLVDQGKVSLDKPLTTYIADFKMKDERYRDITVRMLFNHSSGLPGTSSTVGFAPQPNVHRDLLETLSQEHLKHAPGADSMYCNDGFTLAEILVERVSGQTFMEFLRERVFVPLRMHDTGRSVGELPNEVKVAEYLDGTTAKKYPREILDILAAGGLSSTVEDMCRFGNSFTPYGKRLLSEASLKELRTAQTTPFPKNYRHRSIFSALGWDYSDLSPFAEHGIQVLGKGGNTSAYSSNLQVLPDQGLVIAMAISGRASGEALTKPVLLGLLDDKGLLPPPSEKPARPLEPQSIPAEMDRFQGVYIGEAPDPVRVAISADRQTLTITPLNAGNGQTSSPTTFHYNGGVLFDSAGNTRYFLSIDGKGYLLTTPSRAIDVAWMYQADWLSFQQLDPIERPLGMPVEEKGKRWLLRNAPPFVSDFETDFLVTPRTYEGLDGYLHFRGLTRVESPTYASIAATHFRDQSELLLSERDGTRWASSSNFLYSLTAAHASSAGRNTVEIGPEGYNEWLELSDDVLISFEIPPGGRVVALRPDPKILFDSLVDSGELFLPQGSLLFCAGPPGSRFVISTH